MRRGFEPGSSGQKSAMVPSKPRKPNWIEPKKFNREYSQNLAQTPNFLSLVLIQPVCPGLLSQYLLCMNDTAGSLEVYAKTLAQGEGAGLEYGGMEIV